MGAGEQNHKACCHRPPLTPPFSDQRGRVAPNATRQRLRCAVWILKVRSPLLLQIDDDGEFATARKALHSIPIAL